MAIAPSSVIAAARALACAWLLCAGGVLSVHAEEFWIQESITIPGTGDLLEPHLVLTEANGVRHRFPCHVLHHQEQAWVCGALTFQRTTHGRLSLEAEGLGKTVSLELRTTCSFAVSRHDVVLVIDASDSMKENDPDGLRISALEEFVELARRSRRIASLSIIAFRTEPELLLPPTAPGELEDIRWLRKRLRPRASTDFDKPLQLAARQLMTTKNQRALLFLSDGKPIRRYRSSHHVFKEHDCPIYSIGLSADADADLLAKMASDTGGRYFEAPGANELGTLFTQIFQLIEQPSSIGRDLMTLPAGELPLVMDPSMDNVILKYAFLHGSGHALLDGQAIPNDGQSEFAYHALPHLKFGRHALTFAGDGRVSVEWLAGSTLRLQSIQIQREGEVNEPYIFFAYVTGRESVSYTAEITSPDGTRKQVDLAKVGDTAIVKGEFGDTTRPGVYHLRLQAIGRIEGEPFLRQQLLRFERTGNQAARVAGTTFIRGTKPLAISDDRPVLAPSALPVVRPHHQTVQSLQTTFWSSKPELFFSKLYPGTEQAQAVEILLNSSAEVVTTVALTGDDTSATLELQGTVEANRRSTLTIVAKADSRAAGQAIVRGLRVRVGEREWEIPIHGNVAVPKLQATVTEFARDVQSDGGVELSGVLHVALRPQGRCEVDIRCDIPGMVVPERAQVGSVPTDLPLQLSLRPAQRPFSARGELVVTGPGLASVALPLTVDIAALPSEPTVVSAAPVRSFPWWILAVVAATLLLFVLGQQTLQGNRRAAFVLLSILLHAPLMFLLLPESSEKTKSAKRSTLLSLMGGQVMQEQRVQSEIAEYKNDKQAPTEDQSSKEAVEFAEAQDRSQEIDSTAVVARPEPEVAEAELEAVARHDAVLEIVEAHAEPIVRKQERSEPNEADAVVPEGDKVREPIDAADVSTASLAVPQTTQAKLKASAKPQEVAKAVRRDTVRLGEIRSTTAQVERKQAMQAESVESALAAAVGKVALPVSTSGSDVAAQSELSVESGRSGERMDAMTGTPSAPKASERQSARLTAVSSASQFKAPKRAEESKGGHAAAAAGSSEKVSSATGEVDRAGAGTIAVEGVAAAQAARAEVRHVGNAVPRAGVEVATVTLSSPGAASLRKRATRPGTAAEPRTQSDTGPLSDGHPGERDVRSVAAIGPEAVVPKVQTTAMLAAPNATVMPASTRPEIEQARPSVPTRRGSSQTIAETRARPYQATVAHEGLNRQETERPTATVALGDGPRRSVLLMQSSPQAPAAARVLRRELPELQQDPPTQSQRVRVVPATSRVERASPAERTPKPVRHRAVAEPMPDRHAASLASPAPMRAIVTMRPGGFAPSAVQLGDGDDSQSRFTGNNTLPLAVYSGDWDCDRTALLNLAHQLERRTGSVLPIDSRTVKLADAEMRDLPFVFLTGHRPFTFSDAEIDNLTDYLSKDGYLWINDSTDLGNDHFDAAVRREMRRVLPTLNWRRIPMDSVLFQAPYDLRNGFMGYKVPPGDKYRQDYLEGLYVDGRLKVIYTRNDYGDGLEIDPHTHPLMASLSGLAPEDMQEASVQMGINIVMFCLNKGRLTDAKTMQAVAYQQARAEEAHASLLAKPQASMGLFDNAEKWAVPEGWQDLLTVQLRQQPKDGLQLAFTTADGQAVSRKEKVVVTLEKPMRLTRNDVVVADIVSSMSGGCRLSLAFDTAAGYMESAPAFLRPGREPNVLFDLRTLRFKTANTEWRYEAEFPAEQDVQRWFVVIYPQDNRGRLQIRDLRKIQP